MFTTHAPSPAAAAIVVRADGSAARPRSTLGVDALIAQACARHEAGLMGQTLSPLFPEDCPWDCVAAVPEKSAKRLQHQLSAINAAVLDYQASLTATAGQLSAWLDASEEDVRELAMQFAKLDLSQIPDLSEAKVREALLALPAIAKFPGMVDLLSRAVLPHGAAAKKLLWAESLLGGPIAGASFESQFARVSDARFWRRCIRVILLREREHFFLRLHLVGRDAEAYVSDVQLSSRLAQLRRQVQWMKDTVLVPRYLAPGDVQGGLLTLEQVASSPRARFAKLYAFVKAMDAISIEQGLATAMLTLTLEPEWHPNPSHGTSSWNGASPREAHQTMATRWQSVLRDLDRLNIGVSGLRVVEPHKDGCPHWHLWLLYRPAAEQSILETVMRYFPNKLKVRGSHGSALKGAATGGAKCTTKSAAKSSVSDVIFDSLDALKALASRAPTHAKEGSQVELARIDRSISGGASYAMKYLLKTVDGGDTLNAEAGLFTPAGEPVASAELDAAAQAGLFAEIQLSTVKKAKQPTPQQLAELNDKRAKHGATAKRVDAYRSLWGINSGQLFGVAKCLTAWDELRRLEHAPTHPLLKKLWALARGTDKEGRVGAGEAIRGDAQGFIQALGGLAACGKPAKDKARMSIGRLTETALNGYGEDIHRTKGVTLVERSRQRVSTGTRVNASTGEVKPKMAWRSIQTVLASIKTRLTEWTLAPKKHEATAVQMAEQRYLAVVNEGTPAQLGVLAVRAFWSALWDNAAALPPEPPPLPLWLLAVA
jgi:hypothetical protein